MPNQQTPFLYGAMLLFLMSLTLALGTEHYHVGPSSITSNMVAGLTALGLALAGGMSLIGAAIVTRGPP